MTTLWGSICNKIPAFMCPITSFQFLNARLMMWLASNSMACVMEAKKYIQPVLLQTVVLATVTKVFQNWCRSLYIVATTNTDNS